jgi:serpin B
MNGWAAIHTFGAIDSVFTDPLPATTAGVLTNAFYFKGAWENPFNYQSTVPGKFKYNDTHRIDVQFMQGQFNLKYVESSRLGCRMVSIPYKHRQATMYVILPNTGSLYNIHEFASRLSLDDIKELTESARTTSVTLIMPKMRLAQSLSIRKTLSAFQMQVSYSSSDQNTDESDDSNFCLKNCQTFCSSEERLTFNMSGLSADKKFRMNDVVQHVFLEVNEVGTTAAAIVGTSLVDYSGEFKDFKMDRPFVFFIKHELTGSPIFCGIIMDPRNENA